MVEIEYIIFLSYMEHNYRAIFLLKLINYIVYIICIKTYKQALLLLLIKV